MVINKLTEAIFVTGEKVYIDESDVPMIEERSEEIVAEGWTKERENLKIQDSTIKVPSTDLESREKGDLKALNCYRRGDKTGCQA